MTKNTAGLIKVNDCNNNKAPEGTRDYRFFSGLYLLIRITLFVVYALLREGFYSNAPIFLLCLVVLIIMIRPLF